MKNFDEEYILLILHNYLWSSSGVETLRTALKYLGKVRKIFLSQLKERKRE